MNRYDVTSLILNEAQNESYMVNNLEEMEDEKRLEKLIESMDYSYFKIPFSPDATHLLQHENKYMVPYEDLVKLCRANKISNFVEAVNILADHFNIPRKSIEVGIEESNKLISIGQTADNIEELIRNNIGVASYTWDKDGSEDDEDDNLVSLALMYGEDCKLISDDDSICDDRTVITEKPKENISKLIKANDVKFMNVISADAIKFDVSMVNVYNKDSDYYIEMSDVEHFMTDNELTDIAETVRYIASHNHINLEDTTILCERCGKTKKKKSKKCKSVCERVNNESVSMIAKSKVDKLNIIWLSKN